MLRQTATEHYVPPAAKAVHKGRIGLQGYLFCCLGVVAALPVLLLGVIQVPKWESIHQHEIDRERDFVVESLVRAIGQMVEGHVRAVETLAGQARIQGMGDKRALQRMLTSMRSRYGGFSIMYIAGPNAVSIVDDPPVIGGKATAGTDYSKRDYYRELSRTGRTAISRVQMGKRSGVPNVQIAAPIKDDRGRLQGFVEGSLDLSTIQTLVRQITRGISGLDVAVLDNQGRTIAYPDRTLLKGVENLSRLTLFAPVRGKGPVIRTGVDDKGKTMRASVAPVNAYGLGWTVAAYRPALYEQTQIAMARTRVLAVAALALLAGLIVATFLAQALARPIRKLAGVVAAVTEGDFSHSPEPPHPLAPREMAALQNDARVMVGELKDYTTDLERKIQERSEQVHKANQELEMFVYSVTHDLKAPVISLYGMASLLQKKFGARLGDQGNHYLQRLMSNAGFMEQLITDLLNFSKVGRQEFHWERLNVEQIVRESLDQCDSRIRQDGVTVNVRAPLPDVVFDRTGLCKIFMNLISNAVRFMGDQPAPTVEIGGREGDGFVEYYVKDNGIGIDPKHHDTVFKIFQRLKEVPAEGTGIGLAIIKKILEVGGGCIWFESVVEEGTTFMFRIPRNEYHLALGELNEPETADNG